MAEIRPEEKVSRIIERTLFNYEYIRKRAGDSGPFEVTQLINSFMGAAVHPWENLLSSQPLLVSLSRRDVKWPELRKAEESDDSPIDFHEEMAWIRHAFAHGNITYLNQEGSIWGIEVRNSGYSRRQKKPINWGTRLSVASILQLLESYAEIACRVDKALTPQVGTNAAD